MACAASATSSRNGNMMRVMRDGQLEFAGHRRVARAPADAPARARRSCPARTARPTTMISAVATRFTRRAASSLLRLARYSVKVGTKALESAPSANRSRVRLGMRKPEHERVVDQARAEQPRHHAFAHQAGDAAHQHRDRDDARRADHAFRLRGLADCAASAGRIVQRNGQWS